MKSIEITENMANDAMTQDAMCPRCDGLGFVAAPGGLPDEVPGYKMIEAATDKTEAKYIRTCPNCLSAGRIKKPGDQHSRDKLLEMSGIIQRGKAAVSIVQNFGGMGHSSIISALDESMTVDGTFETVD